MHAMDKATEDQGTSQRGHVAPNCQHAYHDTYNTASAFQGSQGSPRGGREGCEERAAQRPSGMQAMQLQQAHGAQHYHHNHHSNSHLQQHYHLHHENHYHRSKHTIQCSQTRRRPRETIPTIGHGDQGQKNENNTTQNNWRNAGKMDASCMHLHWDHGGARLAHRARVCELHTHRTTCGSHDNEIHRVKHYKRKHTGLPGHRRATRRQPARATRRTTTTQQAIHHSGKREAGPLPRRMD